MPKEVINLSRMRLIKSEYYRCNTCGDTLSDDFCPNCNSDLATRPISFENYENMITGETLYTEERIYKWGNIYALDEEWYEYIKINVEATGLMETEDYMFVP